MDPREKSFDFVQDLTKQIISLATGIVALTITFLTDVLQASGAGTALLLEIAWVVYLVSVLLGIATLMALAGVLGKGSDDGPKVIPSVYASNVRLLSALQILTFLAAVGLTVFFGIAAR